MQPLAKLLNRLSGGRLSPNVITLTSLVMHVPIAWLISQGYYGYAAILLVVFGLFDALDGALARVQGSESKRGMLLDSVTDRVKEVMLYTGAAVSFVELGRTDLVYWTVIACGASLCVSYVNAWGEVLSRGQHANVINQTFRGGLARFEVRIIMLLVGLVTNQLVSAIIAIAVLSSITLFQRLVQIDKQHR